ncbi:MAG: type IV secretory system conjugative DNA transfer family protein [Phormidesmis sp. RL_2_1]|nr:type IV secretory system conjugative DNA transfer family protein [Phormidesmis sp. RL_2_1]
MFALIFVLNAVFGNRNKKNVIGSARWGGRAEKQMARKIAVNQLTSPRHDEVALWINSPEKIEGTKISKDSSTIWLPYMANGTGVIGGSGSGKTYSVILATLRAAIAQGLPIVLLDTDYPGLSKAIAPLAQSVGYEVDVFAPGYPESGVCNVLDFVSDCRDSTGASQI